MQLKHYILVNQKLEGSFFKTKQSIIIEQKLLIK